MEARRFLLLFCLIVMTMEQFSLSTWSIKPSLQGHNVWRDLGLLKLQGYCSWKSSDTNAGITVKGPQYIQTFLYQNPSNEEAYLKLKITPIDSYFSNQKQQTNNFRRNIQIEYSFSTEKQLQLNYFNDSVFISDTKIIITHITRQQLTVNLISQIYSPFLKFVIAIYILIKITLIKMWKMSPIDEHKSISISFVACLLGWQILHITYIIDLWVFTILDEQSKFLYEIVRTLIIVIIFHWVLQAILFCKFSRLSIFNQIKQKQNRKKSFIIFFFEYLCFLYFPTEINIIMFSLLLLLQIRFNIVQKKENEISKWPLLLYISSFVIILYALGCPMNVQRNQVNYSLLIIIFLVAISQLIIIMQQEKLYPKSQIQQEELNKDYQFQGEYVIKLHQVHSQSCIFCQNQTNIFPVVVISAENIGRVNKVKCKGCLNSKRRNKQSQESKQPINQKHLLAIP